MRIKFGKIFLIALVFTLVLGSIPSYAWAISTPNDTKNMSCNESVCKLLEVGVISGYSETIDGVTHYLYHPDNFLTRAEAAKLLAVALGLKEGEGTSFPDTIGHWAEKYISSCVENGIIIGFGDNTFRPQDIMTTEHFVTICLRAIGYTNEVLPDGAAYLAQAKNAGILEGIDDLYGSITRGNAAMILYAVSNIPLGAVSDGKFETDTDGATLYGMMHARFDLYGCDNFFGIQGAMGGGSFICDFTQVAEWENGTLGIELESYLPQLSPYEVYAYVYSPERGAFIYVKNDNGDENGFSLAYSEEDVLNNYVALMVGPRTAGSIESIFIVKSEDANTFFDSNTEYVNPRMT